MATPNPQDPNTSHAIDDGLFSSLQPDLSQQAGTLRPSFSPNLPTNIAAPILATRQQPPFFWKAMGYFLKNKFTPSGSLYDEGRALFLGDLSQIGVLGGELCPPEVTNYQTYVQGDAMQQVNRPFYAANGVSYFEFLSSYLKFAGEGNPSEKLIDARRTLLDCKNIKNQAWETARRAYIKTRADTSKTTPDPSSLIHFIESDTGYIEAWKKEEQAQASYTRLLDPSLSSISKQLDSVRLADMRVEPQLGNNMKVVAIDDNWLSRQAHPPGTPIDPTLIFYRPEYVLQNYETTATYWIKQAGPANKNNPIPRDGPYEIPLANIWKRSWASLGHPALDDAPAPQDITADPDAAAFINSLTASITFLQKPYAQGVARGLWDVGDNHSLGGIPLQEGTPATLRRERFYGKVTRLILAWGVEIEIQLPEDFHVSRVGKGVLSEMDLPLPMVKGGSTRVVQRFGGDGFPVLVGAVADIL